MGDSYGNAMRLAAQVAPPPRGAELCKNSTQSHIVFIKEHSMETQELHRGRLIDHIQLVVRDLAAAQRFYAAIFDARERATRRA